MRTVYPRQLERFRSGCFCQARRNFYGAADGVVPGAAEGVGAGVLNDLFVVEVEAGLAGAGAQDEVAVGVVEVAGGAAAEVVSVAITRNVPRPHPRPAGPPAVEGAPN